MKKIFIFLTIPLATLMGCASSDKTATLNNASYCQQITHQMHVGPGHYKDIGTNKHLATTEAKLQKDYRYYGCDQYSH